MRTFELSRDMTTMTGKFYPTGHILLMLPDAGAADAAGRPWWTPGWTTTTSC
ncbi:hypothetical protein ACPWT1_14705 [Ramlibacter sp. MMS24-I3-19]|uniref:hypothetical protein n=1 Tax=Ramlibacter sp. MMS24-I3-19 TaxID=3416606 RepID=UPI003D03C101